MKRKQFITVVLSAIFFFMFTASVSFAGVSVKFFESNHVGVAAADQSKLEQIVVDEFQLNAEDVPFGGVNVKVMYGKDNLPSYMLVHLKDKYAYSFETVRVDLQNGYQVAGITENYLMTDADTAQDAPMAAAACPDNSIDMVFATCETTINTAVQGINNVSSTAKNAGYKVKVLKGYQENISAYKNWLSCNNLILMGRIGHGSPNGIMVADGTVTTSVFQQANLKGKVIYFNSCQVHKNPLKSTMLNGGVKRFIGGICNLLIGPSEDVFTCWAKRTISQGQGMTPSVSGCENSTNYPQKGCHGISGNGNDDTINKNPNPDPNPDPNPPPDPNSCKGNCGGKAPGGCWCDSYCQQYGDCCSDKTQVCGY